MGQKQSEDTSNTNEKSLKRLIRSIGLSQGQFSLVLANCNYSGLQEKILEKLKTDSYANLCVLHLPQDETTLFTFIKNELKQEVFDAVIVAGIDSARSVETILISSNQVREEFRKSFMFPLILFINDDVLGKFIRLAPDFKSWSGSSIRFEALEEELVESVNLSAESLFNKLLNKDKCDTIISSSIADLLIPWEMESFLNEKQERKLVLSPETQADLDFLLGTKAQEKLDFDLAVYLYEKSLAFYRHIPNREKQGILLNLTGKNLIRKGHTKKAKEYFKESIKAFEDKKNLSLKAALDLCFVLQKEEDWKELDNLAKTALELSHSCDNPVECAESFTFLAEAAFNNRDWENAEAFALNALSQKKPDQIKPDHIKSDQQSNDEPQFKYLPVRDKARLIFARICIKTDQPEKAVELLELAKTEGKAELDPRLYIKIYELLHTLYFDRHDYLKSFRIKQEKHSLEQQFGFRAFIGASRIKAQRKMNLMETDVAREIKASGRLKDVNQLIDRLSLSNCKLLIVHGQSGVGKSSMLEAGLIPALKHTVLNTWDVLPVLIRSYSEWIPQLTGRFSQALNEFRKDENILLLPSIDEILNELRENETRNLYSVLIFDQFEEFFFTHQETKQRIEFYNFLHDCLNIPFVKIILSLREDYIHYLLECDRLADFEMINNDILKQNIRFTLGNFINDEARTVIKSLSEDSKFHMEESLLDRIVEDLSVSGEVRPIELQIVGAQLLDENITELSQYKPKEKLVQGFLESVIHDCGKENEDVTRVILFLLTDENNTRPVKTRFGILRELNESGLDVNNMQLNLILEILVGSGLLSLVPEKPFDRYQLIHDYLVEFIRKGQGGELLSQLKSEKQKRKKAEKNLSLVLKRQLSASIAAGFLIAFLLISVIVIFAQKARTEKLNTIQIEKQSLIAKENLKKSEVSEIKALIESSQANLFSNDDLNSMIAGVKAAKNSKLKQVPENIKNRAKNNLRKIVFGTYEKNCLEGHESPVSAIECSPDGKIIASGSYDNTIKLWNIEQGRELKTLSGHLGSIRSLSFSPDGRFLASGSYDNTIKLWSIKQGKDIKTLSGHTKSVESICFSPDGRTLASGSSDRTIRFWDTKKSGQIKGVIGRLDNGSAIVHSIRFSSDGKLLASGNHDGTIRIWSVKEFKEIKIFKRHKSSVFSLDFNSDSSLLVSGSKDHTIRVWDMEQRKEKMSLNEHFSSVFSVRFSPNDKYIASGSNDRTVRLWKVNDGAEVLSLKGHSGSVSSVAFSPDGKILASGGYDRSVRLWDLQENGKNISLRGHYSPVFAIAFSPKGKILASGGLDKTVRLWNMEDNSRIKALKGHEGSILSVQFSPDGKIIASGSTDHTIRLWNAENGEDIKVLKEHSGSVRSISFRPGSNIFATASDDLTVNLWNFESKKFVKALKGHSAAVYCAVFSPDGKILASGGDDSTIRLWNAEDGTLLKTLTGHYNSILSLAFSPDNTKLASGSFDSTIRLWHLDGSGKKSVFKGHPGSVRSVAFSSDGKILASGSDDNTIKLWNIDDGIEINTLRSHYGSVFCLAFSTDGKILASGSNDRTIKLWELDKVWKSEMDDLLQIGCTRLKKYLEYNPNISDEDRSLCEDIKK
ncbi:hypothetical protein QUF70_08165 [Desulfobacterales bacterium HSG17]|nr:hypothetical protein [Desulfobacterales bacterium HSG17]